LEGTKDVWSVAIYFFLYGRLEEKKWMLSVGSILLLIMLSCQMGTGWKVGTDYGKGETVNNETLDLKSDEAR